MRLQLQQHALLSLILLAFPVFLPQHHPCTKSQNQCYAKNHFRCKTLPKNIKRISSFCLFEVRSEGQRILGWIVLKIFWVMFVHDVRFITTNRFLGVFVEIFEEFITENNRFTTVFKGGLSCALIKTMTQQKQALGSIPLLGTHSFLRVREASSTSKRGKSWPKQPRDFNISHRGEKSWKTNEVNPEV